LPGFSDKDQKAKSIGLYRMSPELMESLLVQIIIAALNAGNVYTLA
jgi:hypothetical protein